VGKFILLAGSLWLVSGRVVIAADTAWETVPNGVQGRLANFDGAGGVKIAG
jgi:hypothetical protein